MPNIQHQNQRERQEDDVPKPDVAARPPAKATLIEGTVPSAGTTLTEDPQPGAAETSFEDECLDTSPEEIRSITDPQIEQTLALWQTGTVIGGLYKVKGLIGHGGMGVVHRVHHLYWKVDLAVKTPNAAALEHAGGRERFLEREAYEWVRLDPHPNVASCFYVRAVNDTLPRIFVEYVSGGSLTDWLKQGRVSALATALDIAIQICWGVGWAHKHQLVHRDLKPGNILMTAGGIPKVTDFGLVKPLGEMIEATEEETPAGVTTLGGTKGYAAPEQWKAGTPMLPKADVFSIGVILCDLLRTHLGLAMPMQGVEATVYRHSLKARSPACALPDSTYTRLVYVLQRCLDDVPDHRYADAMALADELQAVYAEITDEAYSRSKPVERKGRADGLNNRALSLLDLGKMAEAEECWQAALASEAHHIETTYNRGIVHWRQGKVTDDKLVRQLEIVRTAHGGDWVPSYLLALVHLERGDLDSAVPLLETVTRQVPEETEVRAVLQKASSGAISSNRCLRNLEEHGSASTIDLSLDGRLALSGGHKTLRLWEVSTGQCLRTCEQQTGEVKSVCLSVDGRLALSGNGDWNKKDNTLQLWDLGTGDCLRSFEGHTDQVTSVRLIGDGRYALSGSSDRTLKLWETATGQCLRTYRGHTDGVASISLSANGRLALSGSSDKTLRLWELETGECLHIFAGHTGDVVSVSLSADGRLALSGSSDGTLRLWNSMTGDCLRRFIGHTGSISGHSGWVKNVWLSRDGQLALSAGAMDTTVRLWDTTTGQCIRTFLQAHVFVNSVCLSADGRLALSGGSEGTLRLWDVSRDNAYNCSPRLSLLWSHNELSGVETLVNESLERGTQAIKEGRYADALAEIRKARALPGYEHAPRGLELWRELSLIFPRVGLRASWLARTLEGHAKGVTSVGLSADGRLALSGSDDTTLRLWDVATGQCLRIYRGHTEGVASVGLSADGRFVLSGSWDSSLRLWDLATGQCLRIFEGHAKGVTSVGLSADGRLALSGSNDTTLRLWDVATGQCLRIYRGHTDRVKSVYLSPDGRLALSGSFDCTVRLWDTATGQCLRVFKGHESDSDSVCLNSDGRYAISAGWDFTVQVWEVATAQRLRVLRGHTSPAVDSVSVSADGRFVLSGSWDCTLRLWDLVTSQCLRIFEGHTNQVTSVCFSADGRFALSGDCDTTLRLWELDWELKAHDLAEWSEGVRPYLVSFLTVHTPYGASLPRNRAPSEKELVRALTRNGRPSWAEQDVQELLRQLQYAGYGWVNVDGTRRALERMAMRWRKPPPLPDPLTPPAKVSWLSKLFGRGEKR